MPYLGEIAALLTAACWTCSALLFSFCVRRLGSFRLNLVRMTLSAALLAVLTLALWGATWVRALRPEEIWPLLLSGWVGLTLSDWAYFQSLDMLGPRIATLLVTLTPPLTTILGASFLHEHPGRLGVLGMGMTLAGVAAAAFEGAGAGPPRGHRIRGVLLGLLGAFGTAVAYILAKRGMAGAVNPLQASAVRMVAGAAAMWLLAVAAGRRAGAVRLSEDRRVLGATALGTLIGPVAGIWLSLVAIRHTQAGIAATIISMVPVFVLPVVAIRGDEKLTPRAVLGALLAVAGVAVLFARK